MNTKQLPTPRQYFLDLLAEMRLEEAYERNDPEFIKLQESRYVGISEKECTFTKPMMHPITKKYRVDVTCRPRFFVVKNNTFETGGVNSMLVSKAKEIPAVEDLANIKVPGSYCVPGRKQVWVVCNEGTSARDALDMTGYYFEDREFSVVDTKFAPDLVDRVIKVDAIYIAGDVYVHYIAKPKEVVPPVDTVETDPKTGKK